MRIKSGYELKCKSGRYLVTYNGVMSGELDNSIVLADTAVFLWNLLKERDVTKTEMLNALIENFDIGNIDVFVRTMKENGIIE